MYTDTQLQMEVINQLKWAPDVDGNEIGVIAKDGAITLTGVVDSYREKMEAERIAKRVKGVRAIAKDLTVKLSSEISTTDEQIAERIAHTLKWNNVLRGTDIQAEVQNGHVKLTGKAGWFKKATAERLIEDVIGVTGLANRIEVPKPESKVKVQDVKNKISGALHRHANSEAARIQVSVRDGIVTLDGSVDALYDRDIVADAAWAAKGVKEVVDHLTITI